MPVAPAFGGEGGAAETALASSADPLGDSRRTIEVDLFADQPASGAHELIASCDDHRSSLADLGPAELAAAVEGWRKRMREHARDSSYVHISVAEGDRRRITHSYAELHALRFVPAEVARERERAAAYHQRTMGAHLLGDVTSQEVRRRERLVAIDEEAVLIAPWASRAPYELRIVPRRPAPSFESEGEGGGAMLGRAVSGLRELLGGDCPLQIWVRTAPRGAGEFCWHVDLAPRPEPVTGLEPGTGVAVNPIPPEHAAAELRDVIG